MMGLKKKNTKILSFFPSSEICTADMRQPWFPERNISNKIF